MKTKVFYSELKKKLKTKQSPMRFAHSVAVGELAAKLGKIHGWDPERARLAGLLHDYAKEWSPKELKDYAKKRGLDIPDVDFILEVSPNMLHAYVSADVVRRKGWIKDKKDLHAMASHTLGSLKMRLQDKILYIADFSAPGRPYPEAKVLREMAEVDLDGAFRETMTIKILSQIRKCKPVHPFTIRVWNKRVCKSE